MMGRPLKFKTPEELELKIQDYLNKCKSEEIPLTITGLALHLDTDRATLMNYQNRDEFFNTIKRAKTIIENAYELRLVEKGRAGDIFALKNFNWTDKQEVETTTTTRIQIVDDLNEDITEE
jgi:hypothetical protein